MVPIFFQGEILGAQPSRQEAAAAADLGAALFAYATPPGGGADFAKISEICEVRRSVKRCKKGLP